MGQRKTFAVRLLQYWTMRTVEYLPPLFFILNFKKSVRVLERLPDIPFCCNLKIRPFCHTLSKALDVCKNTDLT